MTLIARTAWIDDDGSGQVGTIINNSEKTLLYNQIDTSLRWTTMGSTLTGYAHNWDTLNGHTFVKWAGTADLFVTGFANGVAGQLVTVLNDTLPSAGIVVRFAHYQPASSIQPLYNTVRSSHTPIAGGGWATYMSFGGYWWQVGHHQGAWLGTPYVAGDYTSDGTWTVEAGDMAYRAYCVQGNTLHAAYYLTTTSVTAGAGELIMTIPGEFISANTNYLFMVGSIQDAGTMKLGEAYLGPSDTKIHMRLQSGANLAAGTNNSGVRFVLSFPIK